MDLMREGRTKVDPCWFNCGLNLALLMDIKLSNCYFLVRFDES